MKVVCVLCEGITEKNFIDDILCPIAEKRGIILSATTVRTKVSDRKYGGGISRYKKIKDDLIRLCDYRDAVITSMLDLYQLPSDTPGYSNKLQDHTQWALEIENAVNNDIGKPNLQFNLMVHEFEALLFSDPSSVTRFDKRLSEMMGAALREANGDAEAINNSFDTSPSHRIAQIRPEYSKRLDGIKIAREIGIEQMRQVCKHFDAWLTALGI